jgi:hypothetical protein
VPSIQADEVVLVMYFLMHYKIQSGGFEYPDHTVFKAKNEEEAHVIAKKLIETEGELTHDGLLEAIDMVSLIVITGAQLETLKKLHLAHGI